MTMLYPSIPALYLNLSPLLHTSLSLHPSVTADLCPLSTGPLLVAPSWRAGQRQEVVPALLVQKGAHQADRPSVSSSSSMLSPWLPCSQHTHMPTYIYILP